MLNLVRLIACLLLLAAGAASSPAQAKTASGGYQEKFTVSAALERNKFLFLLGKTASNRTSASEKLFTGEQYDQTLKQQYLRARYYDPNTARFTQMDTWMGADSIPLSMNKFIYTESDSVNNTDPSGNFLIELNASTTIRGILATTATAAPRLGFTFLKSTAGHIVGIAATTCAATYAASQFGITIPANMFHGCEGEGHRGRWQAQGGGLEESEPWSQSTPLTLTQGLGLLDALENKLRPRDRRARAPYFEQARIFARRLAAGGGISAANFPTTKSFPTGVPSSHPRVDLEIRKGHAFTNE